MRPHSLDLRQRLVGAYVGGEGSVGDRFATRRARPACTAARAAGSAAGLGAMGPEAARATPLRSRPFATKVRPLEA